MREKKLMEIDALELGRIWNDEGRCTSFEHHETKRA